MQLYAIFYRRLGEQNRVESPHVFRTNDYPVLVEFITMLGQPGNPFEIVNSRGGCKL
jgi:hypothetical protein